MQGMLDILCDLPWKSLSTICRLHAQIRIIFKSCYREHVSYIYNKYL